jgi:phosphonate C-P lyase system protein PhnH
MPTPARDAAAARELLTFAAWKDDPHIRFADATEAASTLAGADPGTEDEPELSTTLVLMPDWARATEATIEGPGIREGFVTTLPLDAQALRMRRELCAQFPRGVDIVFIDRDGRLLGLPRTTVVRERG